ncbi:MAG: hypothetical protein ABSF83_07855 [Nitrososphaerales archaeon]
MARPRLLTEEQRTALGQRQARLEQVVTDGSGSVEAGWAWYDRRQGVVAWGFRNLDSGQRSVVLLRDSYYFGGAYWPVYCSTALFGVSFLASETVPPPLPERGVPRNSPPLGLVHFDGPERTIACFVFTLSPGQAWAVLEGGFSAASPPSGAALYDVTRLSPGDFCLTYDPRVVRDWAGQTGSRLDAYSPNPSSFRTWLFQAEGAAPYRRLFPDESVSPGKCPETPAATVPPPPSAATAITTETGGLFPPVFPDVLSPPLNP